jgi:predicted lipid-binding transport protein (Tim44 family)
MASFSGDTTLKTLLLAISMTVAALTLTLVPSDADARRLGGGKSAGMQRAAPPAPAVRPGAPTNSAAAPGSTAAGAAAAPKRNWMGPLGGLAAGLGLAALFSHLGMGAGLGAAMGNIVMMLLLAGAAFFVIRFVMSRMGGMSRGGPQMAGAGAGASGGSGGSNAWVPEPAAAPVAMPRSMLDSAPPALAGGTTAGGTAAEVSPLVLPGGMAAADFERLAKMVFIRMQAANDSANIDDLRKFTTPELFASLRLDLQDRGAAKQQTDVVQIDATVVDTARENSQDIITVRFHGLIREAAEAGAEPFNELWHLVRAADGHGDWAIAGITPIQ